jgi:hypothetical protein
MSETTVEQVIIEANKKPTRLTGVRGEVGAGTPARLLKKLWHAEKLKPGNHRLSLKRFARKLMTAKDTTAQRWFENKVGLHADQRSDSNRITASAASTASRAARRKSAEAKKNKSKAKAEAPATVVTKAIK